MCYFHKACYDLADHLAHCLAAGLWDILVPRFRRPLLYSFVPDVFNYNSSLPALRQPSPRPSLSVRVPAVGEMPAQESGNGEKGKAEGPMQTLEGSCEHTHSDVLLFPLSNWVRSSLSALYHQGRQMGRNWIINLELSLLLHLSHHPGLSWRLFLSKAK